MNIWILTSQFPPTVIGGIARYVENAAAMFARAGHQVTIVAADTREDESILPSGARLIRFRPRGHLLEPGDQTNRTPSHPAFPYTIMSHWPALSYEMADRVAALVRRDGVRPDVIECQEYGALPYYLIQRRLVEDHPLRDVPVVVHLQSPDFALTRANQEPRYRFPAYWVERMEKFCLLAADGLLASSHFMTREIGRELPELAGQITVIPLPYAPMPHFEAPPTPGDLVYFGRLQVLKGVPRLVEVCDTLWSQGHDFRLTLMGGDTTYASEGMPVSSFLRQHYGRWIESGQLVIQQDQPLSEHELWKRLAQAWAVLIPSLWENYPNACIEAMGLGKLVIASRSGGQAEMIGEDGRAGMLFDWERDGDCANAIVRALALDADAVHRIGQAARERIRVLTDFDVVLPQRIAHYEHVIERTRATRTMFPSITRAADAHDTIAGTEGHAGLLSVVIPFYDESSDLAGTVASVLDSTHRPLEVVVVTSAANAAAARLVVEQAQAHTGVAARLLTSDGRLPEALRRAGAADAAGAAIAFVRPGDRVDATLFERALAVLDRFDNVGFVYPWARHTGTGDCQPTWNAELPYLLLKNMVPPAVIVRRSHYLSTLRRSPAADIDEHSLWVDMVERGYAGVSLPDILATCQMAADTGTHADDRALVALSQLGERHQQSMEQHSLEIAGLLNANGPAPDWEHPALPSINYRRRYADLLERHERLKRQLGLATPVAGALHALLRRWRQR